MSVLVLNPNHDFFMSAANKKLRTDALDAAHQTTSTLLNEFNTLLDGIVEHQWKQGHFVKRYEVEANRKSEYQFVKGAKKDVHEAYCDKADRAKAIETLREVTELFALANETRCIEMWHATLQQLNALNKDKNGGDIIREYMNTLSDDEQHSLIQNMETGNVNYRQAIKNLEEVDSQTASPVFKFLNKLLAYEVLQNLFDAEKRDKIAEALCSTTKMLSDIYAAVPDKCAAIWEGVLAKRDTWELDERIDALVKGYLTTLPKDAHGLLKEKVETGLVACREALKDVQDAYQENPQPRLAFLSNILGLSVRFFERLQSVLGGKQKITDSDEALSAA
jgi:hypothetical protein